jgi:hypothetical protein
MLYREVIPFCSQIHTKHINTLCGQTVELHVCALKFTSPSLNALSVLQLAAR